MRVGYQELKAEFMRVLISRGFSLVDADAASSVFADNSLYGVLQFGAHNLAR